MKCEQNNEKHFRFRAFSSGFTFACRSPMKMTDEVFQRQTAESTMIYQQCAFEFYRGIISVGSGGGQAILGQLPRCLCNELKCDSSQKIAFKAPAPASTNRQISPIFQPEFSFNSHKICFVRSFHSLSQKRRDKIAFSTENPLLCLMEKQRGNRRK